MNSFNQFIEIAPDCPTKTAVVPQEKYGWGAHYDKWGKIANYAVESDEYRHFIQDKNVKKYFAMRSQRK